MRKVFEAIGDVFSNLIIDSVISILTTILIFPQVKAVNELDLSNTKLVSFYIITIIITAIFFKTVGVFFMWLSYQVPPNIDIIDTHIHDEDLQHTIDYWYGSLTVVNREYERLTECHAMLRTVYVYTTESGFSDLTKDFFANIKHKKLRWRNSNDCEINIDPYTGQEILRVYRVGVDLENKTCLASDFNICDANYRGFISGGNDQGITEYFFEIEVYGKLGNRNIKPRKYFGLVKAEFVKLQDGNIAYGVGIWKIKPLEVGKLKFISWLLKTKRKKQQLRKNRNR